jgi:hypothetical protein
MDTWVIRVQVRSDVKSSHHNRVIIGALKYVFVPLLKSIPRFSICDLTSGYRLTAGHLIVIYVPKKSYTMG